MIMLALSVGVKPTGPVAFFPCYVRGVNSKVILLLKDKKAVFFVCIWSYNVPPLLHVIASWQILISGQ
jgi:hypothetical protein